MGVAHDRAPVGVGDIVGVHPLEAHPRQIGDERHDPRPREPARKERPEEMAALLLGGPALEDEPRPHAHDADVRLGRLEVVEQPLRLRLVPRVEARGRALRRPALVDGAVLRPGRVGADGRRVDERRNAGLRHRTEDALAPGDVRLAQGTDVVRRLDTPGQVDDAVGAVDERRKIGPLDVGGDPGRLRRLRRGDATGDPDDLVDAVVLAERAQQARADVSGGADDGDARHGCRTTLKQPSSFFWNMS